MAGPSPTRKHPPMAAGQRYGRLVAIRFLRRDKHHNFTWLFQCDCGREHEAVIGSVRFGAIQSCGCLHRMIATKHGRSKTPEHGAWGAMISRCRNPNVKEYKHYGGRGITVAERWLEFANFFADMGERPSPLHSLDRINNNGNYEPGNCRWATAKEQQRNRRTTRIVKLNGKEMTITEARALLLRGADDTGQEFSNAEV